ncbi:MAG: MATE family efflux transporter [Pseudomonadota bacterium]
MDKDSIAAYWRESRALLAIAGPMTIAQVAQMGTGVVDTVMAGRYSATDLAAIAIGYNLWLPLYLIFIGVLLGTTVIIAQDYGAGRLEPIRESLPQALWLALALGLIAAPLCYFAGPLLRLLNLDELTYSASLGYLQATAFGLPAAAIFQALRCHTQGIGIMRPFAIASVIGFIANIPLNYALIYGKWGAPELGATGCGWATAISMWLSPVLISIYMLRANSLKPYLPPLCWVTPRVSALREILRVGAPMGLSFFLEVAVFSVIALMIATLGTAAVAAHQIAYNVWDVVYIFLISLGSALGTRVGHHIGADSPVLVRRAVATGSCMTLILAALSTGFLLTAPGSIIAFYTDDPEIHTIATRLIQLAAFFIMIDALQVTTTFTLRAFKDTLFPFLVLCAVYWGVTLPLGYWLGIVREAGPLQGTVGFWQAMIAGIALSTVILSWRLWQTMTRALPTDSPTTSAGNPRCKAQP